MKRLLFTLCSFAITLIAIAQIPFEVKSPEWTKLATPKSSNGINIRKSPSTTAPRPLVNEDKISDYHVPLAYYAYWSTATPRGNVYAMMFTDVAPIIDEQNGWYKLEGIGPEYEPGWVSAKLCRTLSPETITLQELKTNPCNYIFTKDGIDYVLTMDVNEMDGDVTFWLGRLSKGILIYPYSLYVEQYEGGSAAKLDKNVFRYSESNSDEYGLPTFKNVPQQVIDSIVSNMIKSEKERVVCKVDGNILSF